MATLVPSSASTAATIRNQFVGRWVTEKTTCGSRAVFFDAPSMKSCASPLRPTQVCRRLRGATTSGRATIAGAAGEAAMPPAAPVPPSEGTVGHGIGPDAIGAGAGAGGAAEADGGDARGDAAGGDADAAGGDADAAGGGGEAEGGGGAGGRALCGWVGAIAGGIGSSSASEGAAGDAVAGGAGPGGGSARSSAGAARAARPASPSRIAAETQRHRPARTPGAPAALPFTG
jgi:hypothetical protein